MVTLWGWGTLTFICLVFVASQQSTAEHIAKLRAATRVKLSESNSTSAQIFELISAQKAVRNFSQMKIRNEIKNLLGFSVICDLLLGILSIARTIQFTATEIDVPSYFIILKRAHNARELKMKWIQKGLTAYGSAAAGVFEASVEELRAPFRMLSLYGPVAWNLEIDEGKMSGGWLKKCKCKKYGDK